MRIQILTDAGRGVLVEEITGEELAEFDLEFFHERIQAAIDEAAQLEAAEAAAIDD